MVGGGEEEETGQHLRKCNPHVRQALRVSRIKNIFMYYIALFCSERAHVFHK